MLGLKYEGMMTGQSDRAGKQRLHDKTAMRRRKKKGAKSQRLSNK
jgi:hypothetical protein